MPSGPKTRPVNDACTLMPQDSRSRNELFTVCMLTTEKKYIAHEMGRARNRSWIGLLVMITGVSKTQTAVNMANPQFAPLDTIPPLIPISYLTRKRQKQIIPVL